MTLKPLLYISVILTMTACTKRYVQYCKEYPAQKSQIISDTFNKNESSLDSCEIVLRILTNPDSSFIEFANIEWTNSLSNQSLHGNFISTGTQVKSFAKEKLRLKITSIGYSDFEQEIIVSRFGTRQIEVLMGEGQKFVTYKMKRKDYFKMINDSTTTH